MWKHMKYIMVLSIITIIALGAVYVHSKNKDPSKSRGEMKDFNQVLIFRSDSPPGKAYKELGPIELDVKGLTRPQVMTLLKKKALNDYDADAVIGVVVTDIKAGGAPRTMVCPEAKGRCYMEEAVPFYRTKVTGTAVKWK